MTISMETGLFNSFTVFENMIFEGSCV